MEIDLNGASHQLPDAQSVQALMTDLYAAQQVTSQTTSQTTSPGTTVLPKQGLAVAVNREVVPRGQWPLRILCAGDKVDIVRAIGGG
jgi:sulfur carrier protein